jgi:MFS family permease
LSESKRSRPHIFFGWWSVLFIGITSGLGHGFNTYGISVLFKPIAADLELNRAATSWAPGVGRLQGGITSPLVGWLSDKFGPRWVVIFGICVAGTGMVLMNFITEVWHYYVAWGVLIGLGLNIGLTVAVDKKINDWFIRRRGLALGIKFALISLFGIIVVQAVNPLINIQGWRFVCLLWGIIMFASVPFAFMLIKPKRPEYYGLLPDGAELSQDEEKDERDMVARGVGYASSFEETEYTFGQAIRTRTFWLMVVGFSVHNIISGGFNIHVFNFLTDININEIVAGGMMGMMIFFTAVSRLAGGIFADRVSKSRLQFLLVAAFIVQVIGLSTYLLSRSLASVYVMLACHGLSSGALTPLVILILGRYFGRKDFGLILGCTVASLAPFGLLAPVFYGWIHDSTASYDLAFVTAMTLSILAVVTMLFVRVPRKPVNYDSDLTWKAG